MRQVFLNDLSAEDLSLIAKLDNVGFSKTSAQELLEQIAKGIIKAWRLVDGIALTWLDKDTLWVDGLAGDGMYKRTRGVAAEIREIAEAEGAARVLVVVDNPVLKKLYERRLGYSPVGTIMEHKL